MTAERLPMPDRIFFARTAYTLERKRTCCSDKEMTTMKKLMAIFAAAAVCIALAGCSGEKDSGGTGLDSSSVSDSSVSDDSVSESAEDVVGDVNSGDSEVSEKISSETEQTSQAEEESQTSEEQPADTNYSALMSAFSNTYLGLPSADKVYIFSDNGLSTEINGRTYYGVGCYDEFDGTLYYMCDFYVSADGSEVFRRYEQDDRYVLLPEEQGYARLDPTRQIPEDIFAAADGLYMMFSPNSNSTVGGYDESSPVEFNGAVYYPVTNELLNTKLKLMDALTKYFTTDIVNSLMDTNKFTDIDGALYVKNVSGSAADPNYSGTEYELTTLTEDTAVFTRYDTYNYEAGETSEVEREYIAKKENGVWRFTVFPTTW